MEAIRAKEPVLSVYYDGLCPICVREMDHYRKYTKAYKIRFVDIAAADFNAQDEGLDGDKIHLKFHAKETGGEILEGVDAFLAIWEQLETFVVLQKLAKSKLTRPFLDLGYIVFAKFRPLLRRSECNDDRCHI